MRAEARLWIGVCAGLMVAQGCGKRKDTLYCFEVDTCVRADGQLVRPDGSLICAETNTCDAVDEPSDGGGDSGNDPVYVPPTPVPPVPDGNTNITGCDCRTAGNPADLDGDCILDTDEPGNNAQTFDTDSDGIPDGCEDRNKNGVLDATETDPSVADTDSDGVPDGVEDANKNGQRDPFEMDATVADTDGDGIPDGVEDSNQNGVFDLPVDNDNDGCLDSGESSAINVDTDGDLILDSQEDQNQNGVCDTGEVCTWNLDTDCDGITDGNEDLNKNGIFNFGEMNPLSTDTDGDTLPDNVEDINRNGRWDPGFETNARSVDTDGDSLPDNAEDSNTNGVWDNWVDSNTNGCLDTGESAGETDPRNADSDGDGVPDNLEDRNLDGQCPTAEVPDPLNPGQTITRYLEMCPTIPDTDCDGLADGLEDLNKNGTFELGETDATFSDTDYDGLTDGCPPDTVNCAACLTCEDRNNNGTQELTETNARSADSDGDNLSDGCERNFTAAANGATDPLNADTDADGTADGDEDLNRNCTYEPSGGETDPTAFDQPPPIDDPNRTEFEVCASRNLKRLSYATSSLDTHDYRVAFEVERETLNAVCPTGSDSECDSADPVCANGGCVCEDEGTGLPRCVAEARYTIAAYGNDTNGGGFNPLDPGDTLLGHLFQSPRGVVTDSVTSSRVNRDIYGFVYRTADNRDLGTVVDGLRDQFATTYTLAELPAETPRPTHDNITGTLEILRVQRRFRLTTPSDISALALRNALLQTDILGGMPPEPTLPTLDPVYGNITCPGSPQCDTTFNLYIAAVSRTPQNPVGPTTVILVVALTPDTSSDPDPAPRFHADRLTRLDDLTGGSAVARFNADTGQACDGPTPRTQAQADILWVVDDSLSMQQIIGVLQKAAGEAKAVLTSNSNIVDFRTAMTTTNPSVSARTQCSVTCDANCSGICAEATNTCADAWLGCIKECPVNCDTNCNDLGGTCPSTCGTSCVNDSSASSQIFESSFALPGAGGRFYYEDSEFLDCDSSNQLPTTPPPPIDNTDFNNCSVQPYTSSVNSEFASFYTGANNTDRVRLLQNQGFLGSSATASCQTALMDLSANSSDSATTCVLNPDLCCERLTAACADGPTVLASQMCDLIRSMGGLPEIDPIDNRLTSGARPHSAAEHGSRSARRLIESMLPAWPRGYTEANDDPKFHLRLDCTYQPNLGAPDYCVPCDPRVDADCTPIPLVTIFLSDEEDFWAKDDCQKEPDLADQTQLPELCRYVDGNPATTEPCNRTYCESSFSSVTLGGAAGVNAMATPTGYIPDSTAADFNRSLSLQWHTTLPNQCSVALADRNVTCLGNPCETYGQDQASCNAHPSCNFTSGVCVDECGAYTANATGLAPDQIALQRTECEADPSCVWDQSRATENEQRRACILRYPANDCQACKRFMRLEEALSGVAAGDTVLANTIGSALVLDRAIVDEVSPNPAWRGGSVNLIGFRDVGPVYAIIRNDGVPGFGGIPNTLAPPPEDPCLGGSATWGLGDGSFYRSLAEATQGKTQDICVDRAADKPGFRDFIQTVVRDISVLSVPYKLSGSPIASTLQVGIKRPLAGGGFRFISVDRSESQGFVFDATNNTLGFKSDAIDGICGNGETCDTDTDCGNGTCSGGVCGGAVCSADGNNGEAAEINYARDAKYVPRAGDEIFISYRLWRPVPCLDQCNANETCARVVCQGTSDPLLACTGDTTACPTGFKDACTGNSCVRNCSENSDCFGGFTCNGTSNACECASGSLIDVCVPTPECGPCETYNTTTDQCDRIANTCCFAPGEAPGVIPCTPDVQESCPGGTFCDEACVCEPTDRLCGDPSPFNSDGTVKAEQCPAAIQCCENIASAAEACANVANQNEISCATPSPAPITGDCIWTGTECTLKQPLCCGEDETISCVADPESQLGQIVCSQQCRECSPNCGEGEFCGPNQSGGCSCFSNSN